MSGLNLKHFKKIKSDDSATVFRDKSGHELRVAHKGLSARRRKEMEAIPFAEGGEVEDEELSDETKKSGRRFGISEEKLKAIRQFDAPEEQREISSVPGAEEITGPVKPEPTLMRKAADMVGVPQATHDELARREWQRGIDADKKAMEAQAPVKGPAPASIAPAQMAPQQPQMPIQSMDAGMGQGLINQFQQGVQAEAKAVGQQGQEQAAILQQQQKEQQAAIQDFTLKSQQYAKEIDALAEDYKKGHINPNRYMESMGTGQKVMTAIGLILGGMGAGLTRTGVNPAAKFLEDQIARDIEAQKANLGKGQTLLDFNLKQFGNMKDALSMTEAMQKNLYATKLEEAAAKSKDPIAQARGMQMAAQFKAQILPQISALAQSQVTQGILSNPNASPLTKIQALPKEMRDNALKEYAEYRNLEGSLKEVDRVMQSFGNVGAMDRANPFTPDKVAQGKASLVGIAKAILGEAMQEADIARMVDPFVPGLMSNNEAARKQASKELKSILVSKAPGKTPILSEYGIVPKLSVLGAQDLRLLNWAKQNPKSPKAQEIMKRIGG